MRHANISVFIPHLGCPFKCIFCDQKNITGKSKPVSASEISGYLKKAINDIDFNTTDCQIAFFGGSFTAINLKDMESYLKAAFEFIGPSKCTGIRISTRPDYINQHILDILKKYHVDTIELGVQSLDNQVLLKSGRGHSALDTENAAKLIISNGLNLGLQMMVGLPSSSWESELFTANRIIELGANEVRIYPVIVLPHTTLSDMYKQGAYTPLSLETAIKRCARLYNLFRQNNITILKIGLHDANNAIGGPFHPAFGQMVRSHAFLERLLSDIEPQVNTKVYVNNRFLSTAIGNNKSNIKTLEKLGYKIIFEIDNTLRTDTYKLEKISG